MTPALSPPAIIPSMKTPLLVVLFAAAFAASSLGADANELLRQGLFEEEANRDPAKAAAAYAEVVAQYDSQRKIAATAIFRLAELRSKAGDKTAATALYQRLLAEFPDNDPLAKLSRARLGVSASPAPDAAPDLPTDNEDQELARYRRHPEIKAADFNAPLGDPPYKAVTPFNYAASKGWTKLLAYMLDQGAWVEDGRQTGFPLRVAAAEGRKEAVALLLARGAGVNKAAQDGWTALHAACLGRNREVVTLLLEKGADPNAYTSREGDGELIAPALWTPELPADLGAWKTLPVGTPLQLAIRQNAVDIMAVLLDHKAPLDADPKLPNGAIRSSPLVFALNTGREAAAQFLLARGAKTGAALNAAATGTPNLVADLLRRGAAKDADPEGKTPLFNSILAGSNSKAGSDHLLPAVWQARFDAYRKAWEALLAAGADINARDKQKRTALHYVMPDADHPKEVLEWLLAHSADLNAQDERKQTPFHLFCNKYFREPLTPEYKALVAWMIQHGADTDVRDVQGETPFVVGGREKLGELNREFRFPQIIPKLTRDRAVTALVTRVGDRTDVGDRNGSEFRLGPAGELDAAPSLLALVRQVLQVAQETATITVYRGNAAGGAGPVTRLALDFHAEPPDLSRWPLLRWGDVAVLEINGKDSLTDAERSRWQAAINSPQSGSIALLIGDRPAALTSTQPWIYPQFDYLENTYKSSSTPAFLRPPVPLGVSRPNLTREPEIYEWRPGAGPLPPWTLSELVLHLTEAEPRAQLDAIRVERTADQKTESFPLDLRAANPTEAEPGWDGQPSKVKKLGSRLAEGDRLIIPLHPATDAAPLAARRGAISVVAPGRLLGEPLFARAQDEIGGHTLGEALVQAYLTSMVLANPDFSKIVIHRLKGDGAAEEDMPVNFAQTIAGFDFKASAQDARRADVPLQWGDVVEIPVLEAGAEPWKGLDAATRAFLDYALSRTVETSVNGNALFPGADIDNENAGKSRLRPVFRSLNNVNPGLTFSYLAGLRDTFTASGYLAKLGIDLDNVVRFTLHADGQTREYDPTQLKEKNPWLPLDSKVEIQQFTP